ncbi:hypothetical protein [Actinomadura sp. 7K507]|uniref:hypothetical protein n=1 Tax=Actinomadura sp. 7K507 TaxID=2530365 RepID=UPI0014052E55|nr:hypothetical protein [Actinomadura sp. 7K507]
MRAPAVGWGTAEVIGALVAGAVLVAAFAGWERRTRHPMLPLEYLRRRGFITANAVALLQHTSLIGSLFMIAQRRVQQRQLELSGRRRRPSARAGQTGRVRGLWVAAAIALLATVPAFLAPRKSLIQTPLVPVPEPVRNTP